jgi:hypothetical protein
VVDFVIKRRMREAGDARRDAGAVGSTEPPRAGLSGCVEDPATVADLAQAVLEASEEEEARWL